MARARGMPSTRDGCMALNLAEELVLLMLDVNLHRINLVATPFIRNAIVIACLHELEILGNIRVYPDAIFVKDTADTGDPVIDDVAFQYLKAGTNPFQPRNTAKIVLTSLYDKEILSRRRVGPGYQYFIEDEGTCTAIKDRVIDCTTGDLSPDPRTRVLVGLMDYCKALTMVLRLHQVALARKRGRKVMGLISWKKSLNHVVIMPWENLTIENTWRSALNAHEKSNWESFLRYATATMEQVLKHKYLCTFQQETTSNVERIDRLCEGGHVPFSRMELHDLRKMRNDFVHHGNDQLHGARDKMKHVVELLLAT